MTLECKLRRHVGYMAHMEEMRRTYKNFRKSEGTRLPGRLDLSGGIRMLGKL
jgi:hypothetical protein